MKDVIIKPKTLHLKGIEGLEGDRSKCCYAPAKVFTKSETEEAPNKCTKCGNDCELLTEEEKLKINRKSEEAVNGILAEDVTVTVIYKPDNKNISKKVKLPQVRIFAEEAVQEFIRIYPVLKIEKKDFIVVEFYHDHPNAGTKVTSLEK